jgi:hypothetical protein
VVVQLGATQLAVNAEDTRISSNNQTDIMSGGSTNINGAPVARASSCDARGSHAAENTAGGHRGARGREPPAGVGRAALMHRLLDMLACSHCG